MCYVCISEQTTTFALCTINLWVFIIEMESVYCAVGTGSLYTRLSAVLLMTVLWHRRLVAGLSLWNAGFDRRPVRVRFVVDKVALGQALLPSTSFFPRRCHSTKASYLSSPACCSFQNNERAKSGSLPKSNAVSEIGENWVEKYVLSF
jgi:hypothetical protein